MNRHRELIVLGVLFAQLAHAGPQQDRTQYDPVRMGVWVSNEKFRYRTGRTWFEFDARKKSLVESVAPDATGPGGNRRGGPARGRQAASTTSPNGDWVASCDGYNVWLKQNSTGKTTPVTTNGSQSARIKFGTASWVYGEELGQREAMGFSPDNRYLWFYRFDESKVIDFPTLERQLEWQPSVSYEPYPLAGAPNPVVDVWVYDLQTGATTTVPVRPGPFDAGVGHLVYSIRWADTPGTLMFLRLDRIQSTSELCSYNMNSRALEVLDREHVEAGWVEPTGIQDYASGAVKGKMLLRSEASGFYNWFWLDLKKNQRAPITALPVDVQRLMRLDTGKKLLFFTAAGAKNPMRHQLWSVKFDGSGLRQLTSDDFYHSVSVSPSGDYFADIAETTYQAPKLSVAKSDGTVIKELARSVVPKTYENCAEMMLVATSDGKDAVYVRVNKPVPFDPTKKYPVLMSVYGGPGLPSGQAPADRFATPNAINAMGFATIDVWGRGEEGRGRVFRQAIFRRLGQLEIDDMATAAMSARRFTWIDSTKVAIEGTSYGGYAALMSILRYPDVFAAACACSAVTDWRHYDSVYTERYMGMPDDNAEGYRLGAATTYASNLKGSLMLYYGSGDDNVHPTNTMQMIRALQRAQKFFEVQVGPDQGHSAVSRTRMMEFFTQRLGIAPPPK